MGLMDLLGDAQKQREYADFAQRYDEGEPHEGIGDEEALGRYQEVTQDLSPEEYEQASREAFERMSPEQRQELGRHLREQTRGQGILDDDDDEDDARFQDPGALAGLTTRMHQQQPGMLGQVLGGLGGLGGGGMGGGALGAMGGLLGGGGGGGMGGMLSNPIAKAALGGIAAMAAKRVMGR